MDTLRELFVFNNFDNVMNGNSVIWEACKKELPYIMDNELTTRQRDCLKCFLFDELKQKEIAEKLGISQPTVSRHLESATKILLDRLNYAIKIAKTVAAYYEQK
jgi:DNA-directed RNA polymerase specialized sigma subunit